MPPATPRLRTLELGRFIAALSVVFSHLLDAIAKAAAPGTQFLGGIQAPGPLPVEYFFVLSGFVIITAHHADLRSWARPLNFWWRRACRIYPVYWLVLLAMLVYFHASLPSLGGILHLVSLNPAPYPDLIFPAWSLRYEIAFYLMFGLCLAPVIGRWIFLAWAACICWFFVPGNLRHHFLPGLGETFHAYLITSANHFIGEPEMLFLAGLLAGWLYLRGRPALWLSLAALGAGLAVSFWSLSISDWGYSYPFAYKVPYAALGYATLLYGLATLESHGIFRLGRWANWLGAMSYPLYIAHEPLIFFLAVRLQGHGLPMPALYRLCLGTLAIIFAVTIALTFLIDRPLQRQLRRLRLPALLRSETPSGSPP